MDRLKDILDSLTPEMELLRTVKCGTDVDWHDLITRASLAKTFDFTQWTLSQEGQTELFFWVVGTLRGIIEDIIVLAAVEPMAREDRDILLGGWMTRDTITGRTKQVAFFSQREYHQPVLPPPPNADDIIGGCKDEMRRVWKAHGHNPGWQEKGNIRDLSQSSGLTELYDFLYTLTSQLVHFSPTVLLRSGWGHYVNGELIGEFRSTHFDRYYRRFAVAYSSLLFAEFIEQLGSSLNLPEAFFVAAETIRTELAQVRLPELVTFEEMNVTPQNLRRLASMVLKGEIDLVK